MDRAIKAAVSEDISICRAALQWGVPKSSLAYCICVRVATSGPSTYLSSKDEEELVTFLHPLVTQDQERMFLLWCNALWMLEYERVSNQWVVGIFPAMTP